MSHAHAHHSHGQQPSYHESQKEQHREVAHLYSPARVRRTVFYQAFNEYYNRLVLSMLPAAKNARVLELMSGSGLLTQGLLAAGYQGLVHVDLSEDMMRLAQQELGAPLRLCAADAMRLPFAAGTFDAVICRGGIHHLPDLSAAFAEIFRILKPGGTLLTYDPCDDFWAGRWLRKTMYRLFSFFDDEHERGLSSQELAASCRGAGFRVEEVRKFGGLGYTVSGMEAHLFPGFFARLPRLDPVARGFCRLDAAMEGWSGLLAVAVRAVKPAAG